jgi:ABC-type multidrug transport system fused ATPase/permease subunit
MVDVLLGLLRPTSGRLAVDGDPIETDDAIEGWQKAVGYVPQQIFLVDDTIRRNIAFGIPDEAIDLSAVEEAAKIAQLHDFVTRELPDGYDTMVGERGMRLSGGQRQRIGIARALYRRPQLLILDEATSALDGATEGAFFSALREQLRGRTVISIAHRITTTRDFDRVVLVDHGEVVEQGSYQDVVEKRGRFGVLFDASAR